ncbi:MAG: acetyl-CoA carboxylase carboxyltransferase subunit alpha [Planctomycetes bacterium]|nr:acetyl-CoA carboxylase carboxyltransferase subunit alpha [Planctomycetota bacterium]
MPPPQTILDFERPVLEIEEMIEDLETFSAGTNQDCSDELRRLRARREEMLKQAYRRLTPWQTVLVARHLDRPTTSDYVGELFTDLTEVKGDKVFADDPAILTAFARFEGRKVFLIAHRKGKNTPERLKYNFGCAHPEGYRKAARKMRLAEKFNLPLVTLINTPGAYPGIEAEERGQAQAIAESIQTMVRLRTPIVSIVIGEGGSGGALAIGVADRLLMMQFSYLSVISPEGCSAILFKSAAHAEQAADALRLTAPELLRLGICDEVIPEPVGGAHRGPPEAVAAVRDALRSHMGEVCRLKVDALVEMRYDRLRRIGEYRAAGAPGG